VGLTGVIGCGKSLVARVLHEAYGIPVIDMDLAGRSAVEKAGILRRLRKSFGDDIIGPDGLLDRRALGRIVFADGQARQRLNSIVHPAMLDIVRRQMRETMRDSAPYLLVDAALVFELDFERELDRVVTVYAPLELCLQRTMARDRLSRREVEQRLSAQLPQEAKCARADYVLDNSGDLAELSSKCLLLHRWLQEQIPIRS
jgi:dephospho-CoA kinase